MNATVKFLVRIQTLVDQARMYLRYRSGRYELTRQWYNLDHERDPAELYSEVLRFVQRAVNLSPRPYGHGAYGLVLAAIWSVEDDDAPADRWQPEEFTFQERQAVFDGLRERMGSWSPPPVAIMVGVLPYGALALGRPTR